jgi:ribosomal protein S18 acetylase RimI-like enzyme
MRPMTIRPMTIEDYDAVYAIWCTSLTSLRDRDDTRESISAFLRRNPGLSVVAELDGNVIGSILCGHDGRRGQFYHVSVDAAYRRHGAGKAMVAQCLANLRAEGIQKCGLVVFIHNESGSRFWENMGFTLRNDLYYRDIFC